MKKYETTKQLADLEEKRLLLMRRINQWRQVQLAYIPSVGLLLAKSTGNLFSEIQSNDSENIPSAETISLFLPSALSSTLVDISELTEALT